MATLKATRTAQYVLAAEFIANFGDSMLDVNGVLKTFGSVYTDAGTFEVIPLPLGAVIVDGELIVEKQGVGPTAYTMAVGDSGTGNDLLAASSLLGADGTAYPFTCDTANGTSNTGMMKQNDGKNVRITIASTVANATAGKFRVRVRYTIDNRANEVNAM